MGRQENLPQESGQSLQIEPLSESDFILRVNRPVKPSYPGWFRKLDRPEFECSGPTVYNLQYMVEEWLHFKQKRGSVKGDIIYNDLQNNNTLSTCLNLQDGLAIQKKGVVVFRKLFADKSPVCWGAVAHHRLNLRVVPYLFDDVKEVGIRWVLVDIRFRSHNPALRFKS